MNLVYSPSILFGLVLAVTGNHRSLPYAICVGRDPAEAMETGAVFSK